MGKDAARQTADTAGHDGPITSGSNNVSTGGFPAARVGDTFVCKEHGPGVISEGSKTVTINGIPAARKGDKVLCGKKSLPPTKGPKPPEYHYATIAKNTNKDGSVKVKNPEEFQMSILLALSKLSDSDGNGKFDAENIKAVFNEYQLTHKMGDSGVNINLSGTIGKTEFNATTVSNSDTETALFNAKATGLSENIGASSGKENSGDYAAAKVEGTIGTAEAKGESTIIHNEKEQQYGFSGEIGAEAAIAKGEISGASETKYFRIKGALSGSAGSIGIGGGASGLVDLDNWMVKGRVTAGIAAILGLKGDLEIQIGPFFDTPISYDNVGNGRILTGTGRVMIGG
ncbi:TPA: PAAR domain-containing protein [Citrobacter amalonaticus]